MKIYIGYDEREKEAYSVARKSLEKYSSTRHEVVPLDEQNLRKSGLLSRNVDKRDKKYDLISNAYCSTDFANSRFLTPILAQSGWALFVDCDVLFLDDVSKIIPDALANNPGHAKAVYVVKHDHVPDKLQKMDNQMQVKYSRKNWSSVMLFNCDHKANKRLSLRDVNERSGLELHQFYWLSDDEIGGLPHGWNWLVDVHKKPENLKLAHYTLGGPWFEGYESEHNKLWLDHKNE